MSINVPYEALLDAHFGEPKPIGARTRRLGASEVAYRRRLRECVEAWALFKETLAAAHLSGRSVRFLAGLTGVSEECIREAAAGGVRSGRLHDVLALLEPGEAVSADTLASQAGYPNLGRVVYRQVMEDPSFSPALACRVLPTAYGVPDEHRFKGTGRRRSDWMEERVCGLSFLRSGYVLVAYPWVVSAHTLSERARRGMSGGLAARFGGAAEGQ